MRWFRLQDLHEQTQYSYSQDRVLIQNLNLKESYYFKSESSSQLFDLCKFSIDILVSEKIKVKPSCTIYIQDDLNIRLLLIVNESSKLQLLNSIKNNEKNVFYIFIKDSRELENYSKLLLHGENSSSTFVKNIDGFRINSIDLLT